MGSIFWIDEIYLAAQRVHREFAERFPECGVGPPTPIEDILDLQFELRLIRVDLDSSISGRYRVDSGIVEVNQREPLVRQRFTCAHELGHHVLHRGSLRGRKTIRDSVTKIREDIREDRIGIRAPEEGLHRRKEAEANIFASELLIPSASLLPLYRRGTTDIGELSNIFAVSRLAMEIKLTNLRLIKGRAAHKVFEFFGKV